MRVERDYTAHEVTLITMTAALGLTLPIKSITAHGPDRYRIVQEAPGVVDIDSADLPAALKALAQLHQAGIVHDNLEWNVRTSILSKKIYFTGVHRGRLHVSYEAQEADRQTLTKFGAKLQELERSLTPNRKRSPV